MIVTGAVSRNAHKPKHRRPNTPRNVDTTRAQCIDTRYYHDGECIEWFCPRHSPAFYAMHEARHRG